MNGKLNKTEQVKLNKELRDLADLINAKLKELSEELGVANMLLRQTLNNLN